MPWPFWARLDSLPRTSLRSPGSFSALLTILMAAGPRRRASTAPLAAATAEAAEPAATPAKPRAAGPKPLKTASPGVLRSIGTLRAKTARIAEQLGTLYPEPAVPLDHGSHFQLLVSVMLSAQTTDKKVNEVTPALFALAADADAMACLEVAAIEDCIRQIGLAPTKAKNLRAMSQLLVERHGGAVPSTFEDLEALPGVGHKTASVVMAQAFGLPAFPVDTHIHRLAQRWGLSTGKSVEQTEADLKALFPEAAWHDLHLQIIFFGREYCPAQRHDPAACPICSWAAVAPFDRPGPSPAKANGKVNGKAKAAPGKTKAEPGKASDSAAAGAKSGSKAAALAKELQRAKRTAAAAEDAANGPRARRMRSAAE